jgi:hypothetical protein
VNIKTGTLEVAGEDGAGYESAVSANTSGDMEGAGRGGSVEIEAQAISLREGGAINASTYGPGAGGDIRIQTGTLEARGASQQGYKGVIKSAAQGKLPPTSLLHNKGREP